MDVPMAPFFTYVFKGQPLGSRVHAPYGLAGFEAQEVPDRNQPYVELSKQVSNTGTYP